jgi:hypothetical protein
MIGSDLKGAVLESGMASLVNGDLAAVRAASQGTITIRATGETTQPARLRQLFVLERMGGHWKITKYLPEQSGGGCSGI